MVTVEHWSPEQQALYKIKHPLSKPKPWVVFDDNLIWAFFDTEEEARREAHEIEMSNEIADSFGTWMDDTVEHFSISYEKVREIVQGQL